MNAQQAREFESLLWVATDIRTVRIPETIARHGIGEAVSAGIATMLAAALDCIERAAVLADENDDSDVLIQLYVLAAELESQIECHLAEAQAWAVAHAIAESERTTKH